MRRTEEAEILPKEAFTIGDLIIGRNIIFYQQRYKGGKGAHGSKHRN